MFITFFEDVGQFVEKAEKGEKHGDYLRRRALSMHTFSIDTAHIDAIRRVYENGEWKNIVSVFEGANSFNVSDETYLRLMSLLNGVAWTGEEELRYFKMVP